MAAIANDTPRVVGQVLVVGAGPAGIAACLALKDYNVIWVDPAFSAGRLSKFTKVHCNTKMDLLIGKGFFRHPVLDPVKDQLSGALDEMIQGAHSLEDSVDPSEHGFTYLGSCKKVYDAATNAILEAGQVVSLQGSVRNLERVDDRWVSAVDCGTGETFVETSYVVMATGAQPRPVCGDRTLSAEAAFDDELLASRLRKGDSIAVIGNSHSAAIVLSNLQPFVESLNLQIANFSRRPVRFAEWDADLRTYRYTSSGLKGFGAAFGRKQMMVNSSWLELRHVEALDRNEWDWIFDCTGYVPSSLPTISGSLLNPSRDGATGRLGMDSDSPGIFAVGAPWGEPPGRFWGVGMEEAEGFKGEDDFIGFHMFNDRAQAIAAEIQRDSKKRKFQTDTES